MKNEEIIKEIKNLNLTKKELNIVLENLIDLMTEKIQKNNCNGEVILYISYLENTEGILDYTATANGSIQSIVYLIMKLCDKNEQFHKLLCENFEREIKSKNKKGIFSIFGTTTKK